MQPAASSKRVLLSMLGALAFVNGFGLLRAFSLNNDPWGDFLIQAGGPAALLDLRYSGYSLAFSDTKLILICVLCQVALACTAGFLHRRVVACGALVVVYIVAGMVSYGALSAL